MADQNLTDLIAAINRLADVFEASQHAPARRPKGGRMSQDEIKARLRVILNGQWVTFGIVCNRMRHQKKEDIMAALLSMEDDKEVASYTFTHPINGSLIPKYTLDRAAIAAVLNKKEDQ